MIRKTGNPHEFDDWIDEGYIHGIGSATVLDPLDLTEAEWREERKQLRERLAKKVSVGFRRETAK